MQFIELIKQLFLVTEGIKSSELKATLLLIIFMYGSEYMKWGVSTDVHFCATLGVVGYCLSRGFAKLNHKAEETKQ